MERAFIVALYPLYSPLTQHLTRQTRLDHRVQAGPDPTIHSTDISICDPSNQIQQSHHHRPTMTESLPPLPVPSLRSRSSKSTSTTKPQSDPKYSPSAESVTSLSSLPSDPESIEELEKKYDDPYPDFLWMTTEEPHRSRRMAILKAHPEVGFLIGILGRGTKI